MRGVALLTGIGVMIATSGCGIIALPFVAAQRAMEERTPAVYDLGERQTWVVVRADEREVGTEAAVSADPVAVEARRLIEQHGDETTLAPSQKAASVVVIAELAVPKADQVLGTLSVGNAAAYVRVEEEGREIWPADGTRGHLVTVKVQADGIGDDSTTRRESYKLLGQKVASLFIGGSA
jgi:hypothetical protein